MKFKDIAKLINNSWVHQIRAGEKHRFVDISIVETGGRLFVRQYKFGKNSWYEAFLKTPQGAIKCGETVIPVQAQIPPDLEQINAAVTKAFWKKMHVVYAVMKLGFNTQKHEASTLELVPLV